MSGDQLTVDSRQIAPSKGAQGDDSPGVDRIIHFEDHGQDFLEWGIDKDGNVIHCAPFQGWVWKKMQVINPHLLKVGDTVHYRRKNNAEGAYTSIKYPVSKITEV